MMQHLSRKNMASLFIHDEDPLNRTELILQEDSEDDLETTENDSVSIKEYFADLFRRGVWLHAHVPTHAQKCLDVW